MLAQAIALTTRALRVESRSPHGHLLRLLVAGWVIMTLIVVTVQMSMSLTSAPGRDLLTGILYGNAVMITLLIPIYFGSCITEEKEEQTLPLLLMADIRPLALLGGKTFPRLVTVLIILMVQIPFMLLAITLGGVVLNQLLAGYVTLAAYMWGLAGVSTLCSVAFRRTTTAMLVLIVGLALYFVVPGILSVIPPTATLGETLQQTSPFPRLSTILATDYNEEWEYVLAIPVLAGLAVGSLGFLASWLLFGLFNRNLDAEPQLQQRSLIRLSRRVWSWPLAWKDYYFVAGGDTMSLIKLVLYGTVACGLPVLSLVSGSDISEGVGVGLWVLVMMLNIELHFLMASTFTFELQDKTWSTLQSLPYSISQLAWSKVLGTLVGTWPCLLWVLISGLVYLPLLVSGSGMNPQMALITVLTVPGSLLAIAVGLHVTVLLSIWTKNRWAGIALSLLVQYFGTCMVLYPMMIIPVLIYAFTQNVPLTIVITTPIALTVVGVFVWALESAIYGELSRQRDV